MFVTSYFNKLPILVVVPLHYFILVKGQGCKSVHDALAVFGEIIVVWSFCIPFDRLVFAGSFSPTVFRGKSVMIPSNASNN
jgi:hypothetical protein